MFKAGPAAKAASTASSTLAGWACQHDASGFARRASLRTPRAAAPSGRQQRTADEAGGPSKRCRDDADADLPVLKTVATLGGPLPDVAAAVTAEGVTLVMQVPISRLHVLEDQCYVWRRLPLTAAIYIPVVGGAVEGFAGVDDAVEAVRGMGARLDQAGPGACALHADVVIEEVCPGADGAPPPTPLNALRNRALRLAATTAVLLADGTHLVSGGVADMALWQGGAAAQLVRAATQFAGVVVPAFAPTNPWMAKVARQLANELARSRFKTGVVHQVQARLLEGPMGWGLAPGADAARAFEAWVEQTTDLNRTELGQGAEPHAIVLTSRMPWFDERARGSRGAQALHVRAVEAAAGTRRWATMGRGWAIRLAPAGVAFGDEGGDADAAFNAQLARELEHEVASGTYEPVVGLQQLCYV